MTTTMSSSQSVNWGGLLTTGLIAGIIAGVLNAIVFFIAQAAGVDFMIVAGPAGSPAAALTVVSVLLFSVVPGLLAALLAGAVVRYTAQGARNFRIIAVIFLLVSFLPDIFMPEPATTATKVSLMLMHLIAGSVITYMVSRKAAE